MLHRRVAERSRQGVGVAVLCVTGSWSGLSYEVRQLSHADFYKNLLRDGVENTLIMKNLVFILAILFAIPNLSYASLSYPVNPTEKVERKVESQKKIKKTKSITNTKGSIVGVEVGYYISYGGLLLATMSLLLGTNPMTAAIFLLFGLIIALIGLLILGVSLSKLKKEIKS